jgi:preprotein translocase subunit SecG
VQPVKEWRNTSKDKNTKCIFGSNGKIQKIQKYKVYLFCIYFDFLLFFVFLPQKVQTKYEKKYKINTNAIFQKYKAQKKIRTKNFKNTK